MIARVLLLSGLNAAVLSVAVARLSRARRTYEDRTRAATKAHVSDAMRLIGLARSLDADAVALSYHATRSCWEVHATVDEASGRIGWGNYSTDAMTAAELWARRNKTAAALTAAEPE